MPDSVDILERLRLLQQQDWERITVLLIKYAAGRFLAEGIPVQGGAVRGVSIADLVHDAIEAVWSGRRVWDHETVPLMVFLRKAVSSEISNLFDLSEVKQVNPWPGEGGEDSPAEDAMQMQHADPSHDHARHLVRRPQTPEEIVAEQEEIEWRHDLLLEAADDDEELIRYLDALDRGIEEPSMIAQEWRVEPKVIYTVENRLRRRLRKVLKG